jgi:hypothetical protein
MHHSSFTGKTPSRSCILKKLSGACLAIFDSGFAVFGHEGDSLPGMKT